MKITLLTVGKSSDKNIEALIGRYVDRLRHYVRFEIRCLPDPKGASGATEERRKDLEGSAILAALRPSDHVVLLDERGDQPTSRGFADMLGRHLAGSGRDMVFVVGGPFGFCDRVYDRAGGALMALSRMTLTHDMVRLFFVEQLYRAFTIVRGENYHHD